MTNGLPIALPASASAAVIHTFDIPPTGNQDGRPYLDQLSLWVANSDAANPVAAVVTFVPADGSASIATTFAVAARSVGQVFNETVFGGAQSAPEGGGTLTIGYTVGGGLSTTAIAWGWFVRTQG